MSKQNKHKPIKLTKKDYRNIIEALVFTISGDVCMSSTHKTQDSFLYTLRKLTYDAKLRPKLKNTYISGKIYDNPILVEIIKALTEIKIEQ